MSDIPVQDVLMLVIPLVIIQLGLQIAAGINLYKRPAGQVRWNNKLIWALIIIFGEIIGSIVYFVLGRIEGEADAGTGD